MRYRPFIGWCVECASETEHESDNNAEASYPTMQCPAAHVYLEAVRALAKKLKLSLGCIQGMSSKPSSADPFNCISIN